MTNISKRIEYWIVPNDKGDAPYKLISVNYTHSNFWGDQVIKNWIMEGSYKECQRVKDMIC